MSAVQCPAQPSGDPKVDKIATGGGSQGSELAFNPGTDRVSDRDRDMFVAGLAHELRTPLAILKGRLHALEDGVIDPASGECGRLLEQVDRLLRITDSLTTLAHAHGGELFLDQRSVDLAMVVARTLDELRAPANASAIALTENLEATTMICDPARMSQAMGALLRFALLHVPPATTLAIRLSSSSSEAILTIQSSDWMVTLDQGSCLSFPAWEAGKTTANRQTGNIDAALAAALVSAHGGHLELIADASGQGAKMVLRIPRNGCTTAS